VIRIGNNLLTAAELRGVANGAGPKVPETSAVTGRPVGGSRDPMQSMAFQIDKSPAVRADDEKPKAAGLTVDGGAVRRV
jgi:hypothetical protein